MSQPFGFEFTAAGVVTDEQGNPVNTEEQEEN